MAQQRSLRRATGPPAAVLALAVVVGLVGEAPATTAGAGQGVGQPCASTNRAPVRLEPDPGGGMEAVFSTAGGSLRGTLHVPESEAGELSAHADLFVTDVRQGSYELSQPGGTGSPVCRLNPTYHFACRATNELDQLCVEWAGARPAQVWKPDP